MGFARLVVSFWLHRAGLRVPTIRRCWVVVMAQAFRSRQRESLLCGKCLAWLDGFRGGTNQTSTSMNKKALDAQLLASGLLALP
jgi:hypothetical protein